MTEYRNQPGGFWVAGAQPRAAYESISIARPAESVAAVALLSDGAARCVDVFDEIDWPELMVRLGRQGPASVLGLVRDLEHSDPERTRWKRSKAHDDATVAYASYSSERHANLRRRPLTRARLFRKRIDSRPGKATVAAWSGL